MVIYEVNLKIKNSILTQFKAWLSIHVSEMLEIDGFIHAKIFKDVDSSQDYTFLTVQYEIESIDKLKSYFSHQANQMRRDGVSRFGDNFSATRRVMKIVK
jgi:hypothetical protein